MSNRLKSTGISCGIALAVTGIALSLAGCGMGGGVSATAVGAGGGGGHTLNATGKVIGGQQPVVGAQVYLYAAGTSAGAASNPMLPAPGYVLTGSDGGFSITGKYTCPSASTPVYLLALGGNSGGGTNNALGFMAGLGPCGNLTPTSFVWVNELTTVASVCALAPYMTDPTHVSSTDASGLMAAFASIANMVSLSNGQTPAKTAIGNGIVPQTTIDALGNSLAACINSTGGSACSQLFTDTTVGGVTPTNTVQAALNIATHPTQNAAAIFGLATGQVPFLPTLGSAPSTWVISVSFPSDVLMHYNNTNRTGVQNAETILTPANVKSASFGKLRTFAVDGYLFAQPLYVGGLGMPDGAVHDVVYASTLHGSVYAFDADGNNPAQGYLWMTSLIPAGERSVTPADYFNCGNPSPESSVLSTPVIDRTTQTLYAISKTKNTTTSAVVQRLHAISLLDGAEKFGGPVTIAASVTGSGDGSSGGVVSFDPLHEDQRAALLVSNGTVWIAWASHCDIGPYHGWVLGYNAGTLAQNAIFNNTPNGSDGGIWLSQGGPAADAAGYIYIAAGNGTFDPPLDLADGAVKLAPPTSGTAVAVADYFVPSNQQTLSNNDQDVGVSQPLLIQDPASTYAPQLMIESDKTGRIYVLNTGHMGTYDTGTHGPDSLNGDVQDFTVSGGIWQNFAYFNNTMYLAGSGMPLEAFPFTPGNSTAAGTFATTPSSQSTFNSAGSSSSGGFSPVVSANGTTTAIVWASTHTGANAILYAFDATNVATELYGSDQAASSRDAGPGAIKFSSPVVANGMVFLGGTSSLVVYGLLP